MIGNSNSVSRYGAKVLTTKRTSRRLSSRPWYAKTPDDLTGRKLIAFRDLRPRSLKTAQGEVAAFDPGSARSQLIIDDGLSQRCATLAGAGISLKGLVERP